MINIATSGVTNIFLGTSGATAVYLGSNLVWSTGGHDYSQDYFTLKALESGDFYWNVSNVEYSLNDGAWTTWTATDSANTLSVSADDKIRLKSKNTSYTSFPIHATGNYDAEGNVMSLFYEDDFEGQTKLRGQYASRGLFYNSTTLVNAENLVLPATELTIECYLEMFRGCTSLVTAPKNLPANVLSTYCYHTMFAGCTSLKTAPELPATALSSGCYQNMFNGCTSLVNAPDLPATTAAGNCYQNMFAGCTSLVNAPKIAATTLGGNNCYQSMFEGCTSLVNAPELPASALTSSCYKQMFAGCTSLVNAPDLNATTLTTSCYRQMFQGCSNLNYIKCLATDISAGSSHYNWVTGVAAAGTFVKAAGMNDWGTGTSGIPNGWTIVDA